MDILKEFAKENNVIISDEKLEKLESLSNLLIESNKIVNLTAIVEPREIEIKHMIDSLVGLNFISKYVKEKQQINIIDVGCGAGFPGLPLKILCPESNITLLDSSNKKINFVNDAIKKLGLNDAIGIAMRAEDFAHTEKRENFDFCTSRAVARMNILLEYCLPLVKVGGFCLMYKSSDCDDELEEAKKAIKTLGGELTEIIKKSLPEGEGKRKIIVIKKIKKTPSKYPRQVGKPAKSPIV